MLITDYTTDHAGKAFDEHVAPVLTDRYTIYFKRLEADEKRKYTFREKDVTDAVEHARLTFTYKIQNKTKAVLGSRKVTKTTALSLRVTPNSDPVTAGMTITLDETNSVHFYVRLVYNHTFSRSNGYTPYVQYRLNITRVTVDGEDQKNPCVATAKEAFWVGKKKAQVKITRVEPTTENLTALVSLVYYLKNEKKLEEDSIKARCRGRMYGTQGPRAQITRNINKLGLDAKTTTEDAWTVLRNSLPQELRDRLTKVVNEGFVVRGKRGSDEAAQDKILKKMDLISTEWKFVPGAKSEDGYKPCGMAKTIVANL